MKIYKVKLDKVKTVAEETKFFTFTFPKDFSFLPGQFITAKINETTFRSYSICSSPNDLPKLELVIKIVKNGIGSTYFNNLKVGDEIEFRGPFGHFVLQENNRDVIFIATGVGVAPMRCFWKTLSQNIKKHFFFGYRHEENEFFLDEISSIENMCCEVAISQPHNKTEHFKGRSTTLLSKKPADFFQNKDVYICGSTPMIEEVVDILCKEKNMPRENIFFEKFW